MSEPDLTTEIIGYRQWYVTPDLELRAAGYRVGGSWKPGENEAVCHRMADAMMLTFGYSEEPQKRHPCGDTPGHDCQCGFYALHDPSDFWYGAQAQRSLWATAMISAPTSDPLVSGIIVGWGKVEVHHQGFRTQYARIVALALPEGKRDAAVARAAAAAYGVPCVPVRDLPRIAAEFGSTVPMEMRPEKPKPPEDQASTWQQALNQAVNAAFVSGNSMHYYSPGGFYSQPVLPPPPAPPRPKSRFERKSSNRQGPHQGKRPKNERGKPWGAW